MVHPATLHVDGLTDVGRHRKNNEDFWWVGSPGGDYCSVNIGAGPLQLDLQTGAALLLVSDGVGGARAGEVASEMAVALMAKALGTCTALLRQGTTANGAMLAAMREAHYAILAKSAQRGFEGMAATLSALCIASDGSACWAHAGDSRIYLFRQGQLQQMSRDHSPVGRLRQEGRITEAEARTHPARNQIDLSMGDRLNEFEPDAGIEPVRPGDIFLLCSDGLSDGLWDHEIEQALRGLTDPAALSGVLRGLVESAKRASGRDNITVAGAFLEPLSDGGGFWRKLFG